jgi:hypothetical protein
MGRKSQFFNRFTDISLEIDQLALFKEKQGFYASNLRSSLSEFGSRPLFVVGRGEAAQMNTRVFIYARKSRKTFFVIMFFVTLFNTRGLWIVVLHVMVPQPYRFSLGMAI